MSWKCACGQIVQDGIPHACCNVSGHLTNPPAPRNQSEASPSGVVPAEPVVEDDSESFVDTLKEIIHDAEAAVAGKRKK